jgi:hypothetical protein
MLTLKGAHGMATIRCEVTTCRFNGQRRCTLSSIRIGSAQVGSPPSILGATTAGYDGQLRAGYATEFESYVAYALDQAQGATDGAACLSFSPL